MKTKRDIQNNLTYLSGFTPQEYNERIRRNRKKFEEACMKQGEYLPSEREMDRWFKEKKV